MRRLRPFVHDQAPVVPFSHRRQHFHRVVVLCGAVIDRIDRDRRSIDQRHRIAFHKIWKVGSCLRLHDFSAATSGHLHREGLLLVARKNERGSLVCRFGRLSNTQGDAFAAISHLRPLHGEMALNRLAAGKGEFDFLQPIHAAIGENGQDALDALGLARVDRGNSGLADRRRHRHRKDGPRWQPVRPVYRLAHHFFSAVDPLGIRSNPDFCHGFRPFAWRS